MIFKDTIIKCKPEQSRDVQRFLFKMKYYWADEYSVGDDTYGCTHRHLKKPLWDSEYEYFIIDGGYLFRRKDDHGFSKFYENRTLHKIVEFTSVIRKMKLDKINGK